MTVNIQICTFESPVMDLQTYAPHDRPQARKILTLLCVIACVNYRATAKDKTLLANLGITHVVNAADGPAHIDTGAQFYKDTNISYHGVEAADCKDFDLSHFFTETADFIHDGLSQKGNGQSHKTNKYSFQSERFCCVNRYGARPLCSRNQPLGDSCAGFSHDKRATYPRGGRGGRVQAQKYSAKCWFSEAALSPGLMLGPAETDIII